MTMKKSDEKADKKAPKKTAKKAVKEDSVLDKSSLEKAQVTQAGMALVLGLASTNVLALTNTGALTKNANGNYDLLEQVRGYIKAMRERKSGTSKSTLETEALQLKNEKAKTYIESWRRSRDRQVAVAIIEALKAAMLQLKEDISKGMTINGAIDHVLSTLKTVDYEICLQEVENDDEEDEE